MGNTRDWLVLFIGGCSGTGKSTLAPVMAGAFGAELARVDDYRMALQSGTQAEHNPDLHFFIESPGVARPGIWKTPPEVLCDALVKLGLFVSSTLRVVVDHHISIRKRIVLEGDGIVPEFVREAKQTNPLYDAAIAAVFICERDRDSYFRRLTSPAAGEPPSADETNIRSMHWLYGRYLAREAERLDLPVVDSRPWATLYDRAVRAIHPV